MSALTNYLVKFRTVTHFIALGIISGAVWVYTNPQIVGPIEARYPKVAFITKVASIILALYHGSKATT